MRKRGLKIAMLVLSGGVLLQFGGCATLLLEQLLGTVVGNVLSALIQSVLNSANTPA